MVDSITVNSFVKDSSSYLLFPVIKKVDLKINEIIGVHLYEGRSIIGVVDEVCEDGEHFWIRTSPNHNSHRERFSFKIDRVIKLS
jgi:hypothetical protein